MAYKESCPAWKLSKIEGLANVGDKTSLNTASVFYQGSVSYITLMRSAVLHSKIPQYSNENKDVLISCCLDRPSVAAEPSNQ